MPAPSGYGATLPDDVILDSAVLLIASATPWGVSTGPISFDPGITFEQVEYENKFFPRVGLDRKGPGVPKITGTFKQLSEARHLKLEAGATSAGTTDKTITPKGAGDLLVVGDYITELRCAWKRQGSNGYALVEFNYALCTQYSIAGKGEVSVTFEARQAADAPDEGVVPYTIQYVASLPA